MSYVSYQGKQLSLQDDDTVLDVLLRNGHLIPYGCRAGACQSCVMVADAGVVPASAQQGISPAQQQLNYFLSCQCKPIGPLTVSNVARSNNQVVGTIVEKFWFNDHVICLRLGIPDFTFYPGQYVTLWKDKLVARSYSIASLPTDGYLEFHIKYHEDGKFSRWLAEDAQLGTELTIQGPLGECFYSAEEQQPLLLAAIGTGLAPIYGILRDALSKKHDSPIRVVVAARSENSHYLVEELLALEKSNAQLKVSLLALTDSNESVVQQDIYQFCADSYPDLNSWKVYLCGAQTFVGKMRKQCFLKGAKMRDIIADTFLPFIENE